MKLFQPKINPIPFTKDGIEKIKKEQEELLSQRPGVLDHLNKARAMGDLKENGYYQATRQKLNFIDGRLRRITFLLKYGVVMASQNSGVVDIGAKVVLHDGIKAYTYTIVGGEESNPSEGKISHKSPLGRAILGKKKGEKVTLTVPKGDVIYTVKEIIM